MKFNEISQTVNHFAQEQLLKREQRLQSPELQMKLERTRQLLSEDFGRICKNLLDGSWRITLGAPLSSLWEGTKELGGIVGHNFSVKNKEEKRSYGEVPAAMIKELLAQYGKGVIDITKLVGNISIALSRATVLGARYTLGK